MRTAATSTALRTPAAVVVVIALWHLLLFCPPPPCIAFVVVVPLGGRDVSTTWHSKQRSATTSVRPSLYATSDPQPQPPLPSNAADEGSSSNVWLERAAQLRKEVEALETALGRNSTSAMAMTTTTADAAMTVPVVVQYQTMADSIWTFSYRFSDQPENKKNNNNDDDAAMTAEKRSFYTGKLTLRFRKDGYTDLVRHEPSPAATTSGSGGGLLAINKAWGWDVEMSNDKNDGKEYLLFSVDFQLPNGKQQRFYFQARQEMSAVPGSSSIITLKEGTVTMKQDVVDSNTRWGLFSPRGILAEFRYVGEFVAKPSS